MKEKNTGNHAPESRDEFEKEFSSSLKEVIEDIRTDKIPLLNTLLTLQRLLLKNANEEEYSDEYIKKLDYHLYLFQKVLISA